MRSEPVSPEVLEIIRKEAQSLLTDLLGQWSGTVERVTEDHLKQLVRKVMK